MKRKSLFEILKLRVVIGYLGEKKQYAWWPSMFLVKESENYLAPIFGKTALLSRYHGVSEAATIVHDKHIGVGKNVFHLFRLPELIERELHRLFTDTEITDEIAGIIDNPETAEENLKQFAKNIVGEKTGPFRIGIISEIEKSSTLEIIAQSYLNAFRSGSKSFPFFSEEK